MSERRLLLVLAVPAMRFRCVRGQRMRREHARRPDDDEGCHRGGQRSSGDVAPHGSLLPGQPANPSLEEIGTSKADTGLGERRTGRPLRDTQDRGSEYERLPSGGDVVGQQLGLIAQIISEAPKRRQPEERAGEGTHDGQTKWISAGRMGAFVCQDRRELGWR